MTQKELLSLAPDDADPRGSKATTADHLEKAKPADLRRADAGGKEEQPTEAPKYASHEEWLEHNPLGPEFANLVTCPEDLNIPALAAHRATVKRQELLMANGDYGGLALAKEAARTAAPRNALEEMLVDQLAQAYTASMTLLAKAEHFASFITPWVTKERQQVQSIEAARLANAAARTMEAFQRGVLTLDRLQNGGHQTVVVQHVQQVKVADGGQAVVTGTAKTSRKQGGGPPEMSKGPHDPRRGWLKNGNRPGDLRDAPACGAKTRAKSSCRQPAMANGRCRLHGGASTGPRTAEGLERCRMANFKHGLRSAEMITLRREAGAARRALQDLIAVAGEGSGP